MTAPSISVLPDDPKEKQKHVIKMALERFPRYIVLGIKITLTVQRPALYAIKRKYKR